MSPRTVDGVDDYITLSIGALGFAFGPGTVAAIFQKSADGTADTLLFVGVSNTVNWALILTTGNVLTLRLNASQANAPAVIIDTCLSTDGWLLVAATKATGSVPVRFHRYEYATSTWQHADGLTNFANSSTPITSCTIGATFSPSNFLAGDIAVAGGWNVVLTDAQIEALAKDLPAWDAVDVKGLWALDQSETSQSIRDLSGNGANQTAITGTTVGASDVPDFAYVAPPAIVRKLQAVVRGSFY